VVEALRLFLGEQSGESAALLDPRQAKMQAKKWEKFIAQVSSYTYASVESSVLLKFRQVLFS
jgi:hypothetical protein